MSVFPHVFINNYWSYTPSLLTGLFHWDFEAVCIPLSPGAVWWTGLSCSRLSVLRAVCWRLLRLVSIFMCSVSTWKQPLPRALLPGKNNVRKDPISVFLLSNLLIFVSFLMFSSFIFCLIICLVQLSVARPFRGPFCRLHFQITFIFKEVPFSQLMTGTSLFPRWVVCLLFFKFTFFCMRY